MAENRHITRINDTQANGRVNLDPHQIMIETDGDHLLTWKDGTTPTARYFTAAAQHYWDGASLTYLNATFEDVTGRGDMYLGDAAADASLYHGGDTNTRIRLRDDRLTIDVGGITFLDLTEAGTDYFVIDPSDTGLLAGIGITTPSSQWHIAHSGGAAATYLDTYDTGSTRSALLLRKSDHATIGTQAETDDGDLFGEIFWYGVNSTPAWAQGATIYAVQDGAAGAATVPTIVYVQAYDNANSVEDWTFKHNGFFAIGVPVASSDNIAGRLHVVEDTNSTEAYIDTYSSTANGARPALIFRKSATNTRMTAAQTDDGDKLGTISYYGVDTGSNFALGAQMEVIQDGASGASNVPCNLNIFTSTDSAANTNQLFLHNNGCVGIFTDTPGTIASWSGGGTNNILNVKDGSNIAFLAAQGHAGAYLSLVDSGGGANDKWISAICDGGILEWRSHNDNASTRVANVLVMDMGTGYTGVLTAVPSNPFDVTGGIEQDSRVFRFTEDTGTISSGGGTATFDYDLGVNTQGGDIRIVLTGIFASTGSKANTRELAGSFYLFNNVLQDNNVATLRSDGGEVAGLAAAISAVGSNNELRITVTNNDASDNFDGTLLVEFVSSVLVSSAITQA
jgi:hypothetical protein